MINAIEMTPTILSDNSRDYQLLARLYTMAFNYPKAAIDSAKIWEPDIDDRLSILRAYTLNFIPKHEWDPKILKDITCCFKYLIRYKGSKKALEECIKLFAKASGIDGNSWRVEITDEQKVIIYMTQQQASLANINDLLDYILPAGFVYRIIEYSGIEEDPFNKFNAITEKVNVKYRKDNVANVIAQNVENMDDKEITDEVQGRTTQGIISNEEA